MTKKNARLKAKKIIKIFSIIVFSILFVAYITIAIVFEPNIRINGYQRLDNEKLLEFNNNIVFIDRSNATVQTESLTSSLNIGTKNIPEKVKNAFIAVEDKRFFSHKGVDYKRVARAALKNLEEGGYSEGASTISQQLIKNTHLSNKKTIKRKIEEIRLSRELERKYSKNQILSMYLSCIYFGNGIYGVGNAAWIYFGKTLNELSVDECAVLAAIINNPSRFCPYTNYDRCMERRNLVLRRMLENKKIDSKEFDEALNKNTLICDNPNVFNHYFSSALREAASILGREERELIAKGYKIHTYYQPTVQAIVQNVLFEASNNVGDNVDLACIVLDNKDMSVLAFCGSGRKNYQNYYRSPASTIKPLLCYAPCIERGLVHPLTPVLDQKTVFADYSPDNYQDKYNGYISVEDSLCTSSNVVAVKLLRLAGLENAKKIGERMGLEFTQSDNSLALALGGMEKGLSLQQIANAYQIFPSKGRFKRCSYINSIYDQNDELVYTDNRISRNVISEEAAFLVGNMLKKCAQVGTAKQLRQLNNVHAKTGTAGTKNGNTDAYCVSYCTDYTIAVWLGSKKELMPNYISGGGTATRLNKKIMLRICNEIEVKKTTDLVPNGIVKCFVDKNALEDHHKLLLANDAMNENEKIEAFFIKKYLPAEISLKNYSEFLLKKDYTVFSV